MLAHGVVAQLAHERAHDRLERGDRAALAVKVHRRVLVQQRIVLAVVVPDGVGAHVDEAVGHVLLPGLARLGLGVIPERAVAAPPGADGVLGRILAVLDEDVLLLELLEPRVHEQDARLDVGHVLRAALVHRREIRARILEAVGVPSEHAALVVVAGVAAGQVEAVDREAFLLDGVDEADHGVVAVLLQLRIVHGAALVAQAALGQQRRTAGQQRVVVHDARNRIAGQQEHVDVAAVSLPVGVARPIIALLAAHVEHGLVEVVIEHTDRLLRASAQADVERDVLVERVHLLRVVAHGVGSTLTQEGLVLVEQSCLLAKAVEAVLLLHARAGDDAVVAVQNERAAGDRPV